MWFAPQWTGARAEQDPLDRLIAENRGWPARLMWYLGRTVVDISRWSAPRSGS